MKLHNETRDQPVFTLVVGKSGSKMIRMMGRGTLKGQAVGLDMLVTNLSNQLDRRVVGKTGLAGKFNFELKWNPNESTAPADPERPSIFTALEEQLALRLEAGKGPVEMVVIDHVERPSVD